jgi:predicted glycoside hydrolase/deacetylase ChbG (UPF0249 family)
MTKKLIINADDYGLCREVNRAIENLVEVGRLQNISILVNSSFYRESVDFLKTHPKCSTGIHLNIVEGAAISAREKGEALLGRNGEFIGLSQLFVRWGYMPRAVAKAVEAEWRAQIELLLKDGLTITHADSHQHIHAFPPFWKILIKLCQEYGISAMRLPREHNKLRRRSMPAFALKQCVDISTALYPGRNLAGNEHFLGFKRAGAYGENEMISDIRSLKDGVTEMTVHPSLDNGVPYSHFRGELEYHALLGSKVWREIEDQNVELVTWTNF